MDSIPYPDFPSPDESPEYRRLRRWSGPDWYIDLVPFNDNHDGAVIRRMRTCEVLPHEHVEEIIRRIRAGYERLTPEQVEETNDGQLARLEQVTTTLPKPQDPKYIYLMWDGSHYKIGVSKDPESRARQLQIGNARTITVVHSRLALNANEVERHLHEKYGSSMVNGEWFDIDQDVETVLHLMDEMTVAP